MCRIVGIIDTQKKIERSVVENMRDVLAHGGPDDAGIYVENHIVMGHRRLSIIDLSQDAHQPFISDDVVITYNGEIYNFRELKLLLEQAGHHFISSSDTEVIIKAYVEWGENSFAKLNGMFAFALLDKKKNNLYLVRDHCGIKPLYYFHRNNQLIFASEIRAFFCYNPQWKKSRNWQQLFLSFGHIPEPYTILDQVHMVPKGTYYKFTTQGEVKKQQHRYHFFEFSKTVNNNDVAMDLVRNSLRNAVKRHLISDAPIGIFLSGGIDSSLIAILAKQFKKDISTLSIIFDESSFSEEEYQKIIVRQISSQHFYYKVTAIDFLKSLTDISASMDQPTTDGINTYFISQFAQKKGFKAVLAGIGGDELFGGYRTFPYGEMLLNWHSLKYFSRLSRLFSNKFKRLTFLRLNNPYKYYLVMRGFFCPDEIAKLLGTSEKSVWDLLQQMDLNIPKCKSRNYISLLELDLYMKNQLLRDSDVMGMRHSLEIRVPFLDNVFMKDIFSIEESLRLSKKFPKHLVVESFKDLIPPQIVHRPKQGFAFPVGKWLQEHCRESFHKKVMESNINQVFCTTLWDKFTRGKVHWSKIWAIWLLCDYK